MLLRLAYLDVTNAFALLRLLPMSDRDKDAEILALRHQITVLQRQLGGDRARFAPGDRARIEAEIALRRLFETFPGLALVDRPVSRVPSLGMIGHQELPVVLRPA
ncbi:hypothetical protein AB0B12_32170 [Streptomyces sp. NPDC044780]|uniref:hypothetical protein n=1 Tax=unclassified Streptomyces TaxID=2593676 RepID=UPI0033CBC228